MTLHNALEGLAVESKQLPDGHNVKSNNANIATETTLSALNTKVAAVDTTNLATSAKQLADGHNVTAKPDTTFKQIEVANDNVTTVNYTDSTKTAVSTIVQSSVTVGHTATETFNDSGATTLVITRTV